MEQLPRFVTELREAKDRVAAESLFWPSAFLFPEIREQLWPMRRFPLAPRGDVITTESIIELQALGLQYCVHVQPHREEGLQVLPPAGWSRHQALWTDLPVFEEDPCAWHYSQLVHGYNVDQIEPNSLMRPELNAPRRIGYLPNGDLVAHWKIAEALEFEFDIEIEALRASTDGYHLVMGIGLDELDLMDPPVGKGAETGILLSKNESELVPAAVQYIEERGGKATLFEANHTSFYRLLVPVMQSEFQMNRYAEHTWPELGLSCQHLSGYAFRLLDNPLHREEPIFSTEQGNLVVSKAFFAKIGELLGDGCNYGKLLPIIRTP